MKNILVMLSSYNGMKFIGDQIDSIVNQNDVNVSINIRDDGSSDGTTSILEKYTTSNLTWYTGPNLRPARSFMHLLENSSDYEYYSFSDQDDIWLPDKLSSAVNRLKQFDDVPALYFSQTKLVDEKLNDLPTDVINPDCSIEESLFETFATGCTFVINKKLRDVVLRYKPAYISMHDYWIYRICISVGGVIYFDPNAHILYRQHADNVIGLKKNFKLSLKRRLNRLFNKDCQRSRTSEELLNGFSDMMTDKTKQLLTYSSFSRTSIKYRILLIMKCNYQIPFSSKLSILLGCY